jgi:hypothetical protein
LRLTIQIRKFDQGQPQRTQHLCPCYIGDQPRTLQVRAIAHPDGAYSQEYMIFQDIVHKIL